MSGFTPVASTIGGLLIGLAACGLLLFNGRIAGISGILGSVPRAAAGERTWRVLFLAGLVVGGAIVMAASPGAIDPASDRPLYAMGVAGLLVGVGTRLGSGCTSGHGVCGLARFSLRSLVATCVFMLTAAVTVYAVRVALRGGLVTPRAQEIAASASALAAGVLFGVGLGVSGMARPEKVIAFLDFSGGAWDPSLLLVMGGAVIVTAAMFRLILRRARPVVAEAFAVPTTKAIDGRLVGGAAIFGVGWGLGGFCPGPGIVSLVSGARAPLVFTASMVAGMLLFDALDGVRVRRARLSMPSMTGETVDDA